MICIVFVVQLILFSADVEAFSVQRNTAIGTGTVSATISQVNTSNAFILFTAGVNDATPDDNQFTPDFQSSTQVDFTRYDGATASASVAWQVIEDENIDVQRGSSAWAVSNNTEDITINSVNLTESFVIVYGRCADEANTKNLAGFFSGNFTNGTTLHLERGNAGLCAATVSWQVVEWSGAKVQSGTDSIPDNSDSITSTISSVDLEKSFLIFSTASIGTDAGMDSNLILGNIASSTQLSFTHEPGSTYASSERIITWYVVEHPYFHVQSDTIAIGGDTTDTIPNAVNESRSFHVSSGWNTGGGQTYSNSFFTINITDPTTLTIDKTTGSQTQTIEWYVVEVNRPPQIFLDFPENLYETATSTMDLNFTVIDLDYDVQNCSLYLNTSGGWILNDTIFNPTHNVELNFTIHFLDGNHKWNVFCEDNRGFSAWNNTNRTFFVDTTSPVISNLQNTSITNESALIVFNLDELGNATINYGTTLGLPQIVTSAFNLTYHSINLQNLQANTTYYYNVTSCDLLGNCITIGPYDFNTTSTADEEIPFLLNITNLSIADYSAIIHWEVNENTNASVNYGTTIAMSNTEIEDLLYDLDHDVTLTNLQVNTLYYYNVTSCDPSGNCNSSATYTFRTIDTLAPESNLLYPGDAVDFINKEWVDLNFTVNDSQTVDNCTVYADFDSIWEPFYYEAFPTQNTVINFTYLLNRTGSFSWNVLCYDNSSHSAWAEPTNWTFTDAFPVPTFQNYFQNSTNPTRLETVQFKVSILDVDLKNYTFAMNHSGTWETINEGTAIGPEANISINFSFVGTTNSNVCYKWNASDELDGVGESTEICFDMSSVPPTQTTPLLESQYLANTTTEDLICRNQSTFDYDGDSVKNLYSWSVNGSPLYVTYAPFEANSSDTWTKEYSGILGYDLIASATWNATAGYDGKGAYTFNGINEYIDLDNAAGSSPFYDAIINQRTVAMWFKADIITGTTYRMLFGEGGGTNGMDLFIYDSQIFAGAWSENDGFAGNWTSLPVTADTWHFAAVVFDGSRNATTLFYDGVWQEEIGNSNRIAGHTGDDGIGWADGTLQAHTAVGDTIPSGSYFTGAIDEFMAFDKALTYDQLNSLYQGDFSVLSFNETVVGDSWQCSIIPNDGFVDGTSANSNSITILDNIIPTGVNMSYYPSDPIGIDPVQSVQFNISWIDFDGIGSAQIEHNFSGLWQNYSMTGNVGNEFYYEYSHLHPGNNSFRFWANDSFDGMNVSTPFYYLVINNTLNSTENITITEDLDIDWVPIDFAENYSVYYTNDLSQPFQLLDFGITDTNWTDATANSVDERYYTVSAVVDGVEINTTKIIGKKDYSSHNNWSLVTIPFNISEWTLNNNTFKGLQIHTEPENCLDSIYRYDPIGDCFSQTDRIGNEWYPASGCDDFSDNALEPSRGYWFLFNQSCKVSFAGEVKNTTVDYSLQPDYNIVGWFSVVNATLPTFGEPPTYPVDVSLANSVTLAIRYNDITERFEHTGHYDDWGWWPYSGSDSFVSLEPMKSYYFVASQATTWSYSTQ